MTNTASFSLLTAFSATSHGGNPAAVVFLDLDLPIDALRTIAKNFNQPITAFVSTSPLAPKDEKTASFGIRWFSATDIEVPLCGHGTLAAATAVFQRPDLVSEEVEVIEFHTRTHGIMSARKLDGGFIEIRLPVVDQCEVSSDEKAKLIPMIFDAFGKEVVVKYISKGGKGFEHYIMIELDEELNLSQSRVNASAFRNSGYFINILTTASSDGGALFVSRMFAPGVIPGGEDHVCGSAHCMLGPHWYLKLGVSAGSEIKARQVSPRGGDLRLVWESDNNKMILRGEVTVLAQGELQVPT